MYEHRKQRPIPHEAFVWRLVKHMTAALVFAAGSLAGGMAGYVYFERMSWLDGFLNAAMLLGGMGPVATLATPEGKLFAGLYALYAGICFLIVAGIILAPAVHRFLHRFHWDEKDR
jgi:hypothetical protein